MRYVNKTGGLSRRAGVLLSTNLERNLTLIVLAAGTSDFVFVNQVLAVNAATLDNCQLVPADRTMRLHDVSIAIPARKAGSGPGRRSRFGHHYFFPPSIGGRGGQT
jgi:hypothetical protein